MGYTQSLPNIFSLFTMYPMQKLLKVYDLFLWNHHFFLFGQQQEFIRIVIIFRLLLTKSKKNLGLIFKNHFSTVSTYHPSCHKFFFKFVSSCIFNLSSEFLKLIYNTSFARQLNLRT